MEDYAKSLDVTITSVSRVHDVMVSDPVVFEAYSFLFSAAGLGLFSADATFTPGIIQVTLAGLFFVGARERAKFNQFRGNINFVFVLASLAV